MTSPADRDLHLKEGFRNFRFCPKISPSKFESELSNELAGNPTVLPDLPMLDAFPANRHCRGRLPTVLEE
jgi:hypothetical protein